VIDEMVYLSVIKKGIWYVFGLHIQNHSQTFPYCGYQCDQRTILNLVCLSNGCTTPDIKEASIVQWNNGTYVSLTQQPNGMSFFIKSPGDPDLKKLNN
ncbi:MAG: hypothetical protein K0R94_1710, partial [Burkholderiales bacterium]|nr:hypothetical protein [Burkholderiales bacterium]